MNEEKISFGKCVGLLSYRKNSDGIELKETHRMEKVEVFEVLDPGILTTIQDLGRYGFSNLEFLLLEP